MLKALVVAKGTFNSKAIGEYNVPWRRSQPCLSEWLIGERFDGFLLLPEAQCHFIFTASFVWLVVFFFFLLFILLCIYKYMKIKLRFQLNLLPRLWPLKQFLACCLCHWEGVCMQQGNGSLEQGGTCY